MIYTYLVYGAYVQQTAYTHYYRRTWRAPGNHTPSTINGLGVDIYFSWTSDNIFKDKENKLKPWNIIHLCIYHTYQCTIKSGYVFSAKINFNADVFSSDQQTLTLVWNPLDGSI